MRAVYQVWNALLIRLDGGSGGACALRAGKLVILRGLQRSSQSLPFELRQTEPAERLVHFSLTHGGAPLLLLGFPVRQFRHPQCLYPGTLFKDPVGLDAEVVIGPGHALIVPRAAFGLGLACGHEEIVIPRGARRNGEGPESSPQKYRMPAIRR